MGRGLPRSCPASHAATRSAGRTVADSPTRWNGRPVSHASRSSESVRCVPRLFGARAWTSSTITASTEASVFAARSEVSIR
jgi:hypothetical protein